MTEDNIVSLDSSLDDAAKVLLQLATKSGNTEEVDAATLAEKVKAFQAVVQWWETKAKHTPPPPNPNGDKFARLKSKLHGTGDGTAPRGRGRSRKETNGFDSPDPAGSPAGTEDSGAISERYDA